MHTVSLKTFIFFHWFDYFLELNSLSPHIKRIYYGTVEVFDIFNPKSFIYYDIENPKDALNEIARLENNSTAYDDVMAEPILLEGNKTIQKYFSLSDEIIPNAMLKKKIREMVYSRCQ
jgi:hypothetical protein